MKQVFMASCLVLMLAPSVFAQDKADPARVDAVIAAMYSSVSPDWKARTILDETQRMCTQTRSNPPSKEAEAIMTREAKTVVLPADGQYLGDWKRGFEVANNGRGGQFSDAPNTVAGGNCYACHQMDPKELSFGTLGPSLVNYGKDRKDDQDALKMAYTKIVNSNAAVACSMMPRFGTQKILNEQQIKDVMAYLFDLQSPVNK